MHSTQSHIISAHHTASEDSTPPRWEMRVKRQHIPAALLWKQLTATPLTEHQWCPGISGPHSENHCSTRKETALKGKSACPAHSAGLLKSSGLTQVMQVCCPLCPLCSPSLFPFSAMVSLGNSDHSLHIHYHLQATHLQMCTRRAYN